jgi:hypothetical protein
MLYSLEYPKKEIIADFYYVALKTRISGSKLINELKSDVNIYNIIFVNTIRILIVNSERHMEILRHSLSKLFNPQQMFDIYGEGFSMELCVDNILLCESDIPQYDQFYRDVEAEKNEILAKRRSKAMNLFNEIAQIYYPRGLCDLIDGKSTSFIEWILNHIVKSVFIKLNFIKPNFYVYDRVKTVIINVLRHNPYGLSIRESKILRDIESNHYEEIKKFIKLLDQTICKCDFLIGTDNFIGLPNNKYNIFCTGDIYCGLHTKGYITSSAVKINTIKNALVGVPDKTFYESLYKDIMLYIFCGIKKLTPENALIRIILEKWIRI